MTENSQDNNNLSVKISSGGKGPIFTIVAIVLIVALAYFMYLKWQREHQKVDTINHAVSTVQAATETQKATMASIDHIVKKKVKKIHEEVHNEAVALSADALADGIRYELQLYLRERDGEQAEE